MLRCFRSFAVLALVLIGPVAGAQAINRAASGLAAPAQTITFEGQADFSAANTQYAGQGVTFGPTPESRCGLSWSLRSSNTAPRTRRRPRLRDIRSRRSFSRDVRQSSSRRPAREQADD